MVLLGHRHPDRTWSPNVWDVPGGHIDLGETPVQALARELEEELGVQIDVATAVSVLEHAPKPDLDIEVWAIASWTGDVINAQPAEHDQIGWFSIEQLDYLVLADAGVATACRRAVEQVACRSHDAGDERAP